MNRENSLVSARDFSVYPKKEFAHQLYGLRNKVLETGRDYIDHIHFTNNMSEERLLQLSFAFIHHNNWCLLNQNPYLTL